MMAGKPGKGGPRSVAGKARASRNATQHGLLSRALLLPDEDPEEYRLLLDGLIAELGPRGMLELALVERIAIAIWRQRRLVRVENARIQLARRPDSVDRMRVSQEFGENDGIVEEILAGIGDERDRVWSRRFTAALALDPLTLDTLNALCPEVWTHLVQCARAHPTIPDYLQQKHQGSLLKFAAYWSVRMDKILAARTRLALSQAANGLPAAPELMTRYQAALDAELYKAMRVLRDAQRYRAEFNALNAQPVSSA